MASLQTVNPSIVEWFAGNEGHRCGYCKRENTNFSHGMWAHAMTVEDYQDLIDRGWRRSGKYCYKPTMKLTCCPNYTIRCDAPQFKLSNSQKKVLKRVNRFLIKGDKSVGKSVMETELTPSTCEAAENPPTSTKALSDSRQETSKTTLPGKSAELYDTMREKAEPKRGTGADPNKPVCRKAKDIRKEKKLLKMAAKSNIQASTSTSTCVDSSSKSNQPKSLEELLEEPSQVENPAHTLEIKVVRSSPRSLDFIQALEESHSVYHKYQTTIHKDPPGKPSLQQYTRFLVDSPLKIKLIRSSPPSQEWVKSESESFKLFSSYQTRIHKETPEETTRSGYKQFLADSPLQAKKSEKLPDGYGSFHQHYILDGKLIAVGVVDILLHCVSSVYLYYDPDYDFLSLGTYSALQELAFTRKLHKQEPKINFYYMGYYIHTCPKMKYKGQYFPSYLLCPEAYTWQPIEKCIGKLDQNNYSRLDEDTKKEDKGGKINVDEVRVLHDGTMMTYKQYGQLEKRSDREDVLQYAGLVGKNCAQRILLFRK